MRKLPNLDTQTVQEIDFMGVTIFCRRLRPKDLGASYEIEGVDTDGLLAPNLLLIAKLMHDYTDDQGNELTLKQKYEFLSDIEIGDMGIDELITYTNGIIESLGFKGVESLVSQMKDAEESAAEQKKK